MPADHSSADPSLTTDLRERLQTSLGTAYTLERELGGGQSRVFLATETALRRRVVVKVLSPDLVEGLSAERFAREIQLAAALQDPHIVPVLTAGETGGLPYYTMPFVEGESLRASLVRGDEMSIAQAVSILRDMALALDCAHTHGVVHRDIKPENVLLAGRTAVVADFGIAKALDAARERQNRSADTLTGSGQSLGTPAYMAPEQVAGDAVDHRADIYAWGVVAYELLAGRHPFAGKANAQALMRAHVLDMPAALVDQRPGLPPALARLVMQALEKSVETRPQSAGSIVQALDVITTSGGMVGDVTARTTAAGANAGSRLNRPGVLLALATAIMALGAVGILVWSSSPEPPADGPKRIAVLPFENQGAVEDEYFADALTDEIRGKLGTIPGIEVIARGSSTPYKKSTKPPQDIAKELGVHYLLMAVVRWEKGNDGRNVVHVIPELVQAAGDAAPTSRWQDRFDQPLTNVFQVQADIAGRVAAALDVALAVPTQTQLAERPTTNLTAYDAYLKGVAEQASGTSDAASLRRIADHFERAVALDSTFVGAWARLAFVLSNLSSVGVPAPAVIQRARYAADRVAALAPNTALSHVATATALRMEGDVERARHEYDLALAASPNDLQVLRSVASSRRVAGRWREALELTERAAALDPRSAFAMVILTHDQLHLRRPDDVLAVTARARGLSPTSLDVLQNEVAAYLQRGDTTLARQSIAQRSNLDQPSLVAYFAQYWDMYWILDDAQQQLALRLPVSAYDNDDAGLALVRAELYALRGDSVRKRAYGDTAQARLASQLKTAPNDAQRHVMRGLALSFAGIRDEAVQEAARSAELAPLSKDAVNYVYLLHQRVRVYIEVGETKRALDGIEELLARPYFVTRAWLRVDPNFAPLRGNPRFEQLVSAPRPS